MSERKFLCECCHEEYWSDPEWTEEEAQEEWKRNFPNNEPRAKVCDDCFKEIMKYHGHEIK